MVRNQLSLDKKKYQPKPRSKREPKEDRKIMVSWQFPPEVILLVKALARKKKTPIQVMAAELIIAGLHKYNEEVK